MIHIEKQVLNLEYLLIYKTFETYFTLKILFDTNKNYSELIVLLKFIFKLDCVCFNELLYFLNQWFHQQNNFKSVTLNMLVID